MKRVLAITFAALIVCGPAPAQMKKTFLGDSWKGEVVSADAATREITIRFEEGGRTETFTGVLVEDYKVKQPDGSSRELPVSEIRIGSRVRVFAKTKERKTAAGKVKFYSISSINFLGKDELTRAREALGLQPSVVVAHDAAGDLPAANPLKVYLADEGGGTRNAFVLWASKWNKEQAAKYGAVEFVANFAEADVSLVVLDGDEDIPVAQLSISVSNENVVLHPITVLLVSRKGDGLAALWRQGFLSAGRGGPPIGKGQVTDEIEKRLKARVKK